MFKRGPIPALTFCSVKLQEGEGGDFSRLLYFTDLDTAMS